MTSMIKKIEEIAREAGDIILSAHNQSGAADHRRNNAVSRKGSKKDCSDCLTGDSADGPDLHIENKEGRANFVTIYDKKVQDFLTARLKEVIPDAKFLGEENGMDAFQPGDEEGWLFVIDPIDGTTNFIHNMYPYVTSIGLMKDGAPYAGVVYIPLTGQMFSAERGQGAYENGKRIHSSRAPLADSIMLTGSAGFSMDAFQIAQGLSRDFMARCQGVRSTGSAEYSLCMAASGRCGGYCEMRLCLWDYIAGGLILEEAGGRLTDYYGKPLTWRGPSSVLGLSEGVARERDLPDSGYYQDKWETLLKWREKEAARPAGAPDQEAGSRDRNAGRPSGAADGPGKETGKQSPNAGRPSGAADELSREVERLRLETGRLGREDIRNLAKEALRVIPERVAYYAPRVGVSYGRITIRNQRTRWGSCSGKKNLNFNCLLMLTPPEVLDSVVVHELCHILEMNHSKRFYENVLRVYPDYYKNHAWLKENGGALLRRMTG